MDVLEIGGDFDWRHRPYEACLPWPATHTWYSLGREALRAAVCQAGSRHVWLPGYFCRDAILYLEGAGYPVSFYRDSPVQLQPSWDSLDPQPGDAVVAVNYFGLRSGEAWREWSQKRPDVVLVEDHTHDPFSPWARASTADFAFASARKTFPIPDGGILWSPSGRELPARASSSNWLASTLKTAGMVSKSIYLDSSSRSAALKHATRWFLKSGDQTLCSTRMRGLSPWARLALPGGAPLQWRARREQNVRLFLDLFLDFARGLASPAPLFREWPEGNCPFNPVLLFRTREQRDRVHRGLIGRGVFCPVHWPQTDNAPADCRDLADRILTLPLDQRYGASAVRYVWESLVASHVD